MCGIAGYYHPLRAANAETVGRMCARIRHRGPDSEGIHVDRGCGIGMRRLAIIDLSTGDQPMASEDQSAWLVYNGEVYNYRELREELIARGHRLRTTSDTEAIVRLFAEEGVDSIARLRGMFAFAVWNARTRELTLARDRFGKKPLYYAITAEGIQFASEIKCFRELETPWEIDQHALRLYLRFGYIPDPLTPFTRIKKLAPGGWLTYDSQGRVREGRYWRLPVPAEHSPAGLSREGAARQIRDLFDESVRLRMIADVPLGAFLSGGIDSSSVVASMALQSKDPVKTFSIGFEEASFNELDWARAVAQKYKTEHHEIVVRPNSVDLVQKIAAQFDEPFGDSSAIPTYIVSEFAVEHVKVVLSGDGGDELFAGYESFFKIENTRFLDRVPRWMRPGIAGLARALPYSAYGKNYLWMASRPTALERYFEFNHTPYMLRRELLTPEWMLPEDGAFLRHEFSDFLAPEDADVLTQAFYFEATAKLAGDMLVKVDRMSMANSLEVRCPLLDHKVAELAMSIGPEWKMRGGQGKAIFIEAVGDRLPPELLNRPKMGFAVPLPIWLKGSLREFLRDHLAAKAFRSQGIVRTEFVERLIREHETDRRDNHTRLWNLLMLAMWFEEWEQSGLGAPAQRALQGAV
jgi:asparagine synthase (glutamine-hydrolysing)